MQRVQSSRERTYTFTVRTTQVHCTDVCKCTQCTNTATGEVREGSASVLLEDFS